MTKFRRFLFKWGTLSTYNSFVLKAKIFQLSQKLPGMVRNNMVYGWCRTNCINGTILYKNRTPTPNILHIKTLWSSCLKTSIIAEQESFLIFCECPMYSDVTNSVSDFNSVTSLQSIEIFYNLSIKRTNLPKNGQIRKNVLF